MAALLEGDNSGASESDSDYSDISSSQPVFALPGASLSYKDLSFKVPDTNGADKTILAQCSGHFEAGQLVALMGPSGCGKSTMLDMLAMKKTAKYSGDVYVNGHKRDPKTFNRVAVYVGQEDVMPQHWRVREAIKFNANLKTQANKAKKVGEAPVDLLIEAFGLGGVKDTFIGGSLVRGISGGQRRRVTLARGVAAQASLLFCDEPTSGLSATDAELCVKALKAIAKSLGVLILVVIHQPRLEVAQLFDTLVLLTSGPGRVCYHGPMSQAYDYMEACGRTVPQHVNPTDFFLDLVTPGLRLDASDHFVSEFQVRLLPKLQKDVDMAVVRKGLTVQEMLAAKPGARLGKYAVPFCSQFVQLLRRKVAITLRNPLAVGLPVMLPVALGVVVGAMFSGVSAKLFQLQVSFVFILVTVLGLGGLQLMPIGIEERHYMKHETSEALYSEGAAVLASFVVDVPLAFMGAAYEVLICFAFSGLDSSHLNTLFFWCMLTFLVYDSLFGMIAAIAQDGQQAQALATPLLAIFLLCNGFIITKTDAPGFVHAIFPISPNLYAMQAIVHDLAQTAGPGGQAVLDWTGYTSDENAQGVVVMVIMIVVFRICQLIALKFLHNIQK